MSKNKKKTYERVHRLLKILTLIQADRGWTAARLAETCGTSVRTIYRDMKMLEGAGIPYFYDEQTGGYRIRRDFFMPPVELTLDESLALLALAQQIGGREQVPFTKPAAKAMAKVKGVLPAAIRQELEPISEHIAIRLAAAASEDGVADVYEQVRDAVSRRRVLKCTYDPTTSPRRSLAKREKFEFRPYTLLFSQRAWYAVGHHSGRRAIRKLKLNRFTHLELTGKPYAIPDDFSIERELGDAWRMIGGDKTYQVRLWFDPEFAETIADTHWHRTQHITWHDDGSIHFECRVDGLDEIVWWVLSMGPYCRVEKPRALAGRVRRLSSKVADLYAND